MFTGELPLPGAEELGVYVLGNGVGESIVLLFPDGRTVVVDACTAGADNLPAELLRHVGRTRIDLLVLTHPDLDHIRGFAELVQTFDPRRVWRYPYDAAIREVLASAAVGFPDVAKAMAALDEHQEKTGRVSQASYATDTWPQPRTTHYEVRALAPTHSDQSRFTRVWRKVLATDKGIARLSSWFKRVLAGQAKLGDKPNVLSLGLSVAWGDHRIVLGGDVMNGLPGSRHSGWKAIVTMLREDGRDWLEAASVVKVAHHGSRHSFEPVAWDRHASGGKVIALLAPFTSASLPDAVVLAGLRTHASLLGISAVNGATTTRATTAGWTPEPTLHAGAAGCGCVGAIVPRTSAPRAFAVGAGSVLR